MTKEQKEQREKAMYRSSGVCAVCGKPLNEGYPQYAHRIPNKEIYRKKYGSMIIDHTLNGEMVCSLGCNQTIDCGSSYGNQLEIIAHIVIAEYLKLWGSDGLDKLSDMLIKEYEKIGIRTGENER